MKLNIGPRGILQIDDARVIYRNFSGEGSTYNRPGDRNFSVIIPTQELADVLLDNGWNVKIKAPREEGDAPFMHLPVKVKFNNRGPAVYLKTGEAMNRLDEEAVGQLDHIEYRTCDLDIRPFDWEMNGKSGRTAYLQSMMMEQEIDRFMARYAEEEYPQE